jgi:hypothetical protein
MRRSIDAVLQDTAREQSTWIEQLGTSPRNRPARVASEVGFAIDVIEYCPDSTSADAIYSDLAGSRQGLLINIYAYITNNKTIIDV